MDQLELLKADIKVTLKELQAQIDQLKDYAHVRDIPVSKLQDKTGQFMMTGLLTAKAQMLSSLTLLEGMRFAS